MRELVDPPALREQTHGLVSDANKPSYSGNLWENGISFTPDGCSAVFGHVWGCPSEDLSDTQQCIPAADFGPILLETALEWSTLDMGANPRKRVSDALEFGTSAALERILSMGLTDDAGPIVKAPLSQAISLADISGKLIATSVLGHPTFKALVPTPNPKTTSDKKNFALLEAKLLDASDHTGSAGTILINPVDLVEAYDLCEGKDGKLWSKLTGSQVIVGNFVPGVAYGVIGEVDLYLGEIDVIETVTQRNNSWVGRAQRSAIVAFNTCAVFGQTMSGLTP